MDFADIPILGQLFVKRSQLGGIELFNAPRYFSILNRMRVVPVTAQTFTNAATGSASVGGEPGSMRYGGSLGTTANSTLRFYPSNTGNSLQQSLHEGDANTRLNFSARWSFSFSFAVDSQHSTATTYFMLGISAATAYGAPVTKSVGIRIVNGALTAFWHDGTTLSFSSTIGTVDAFTARRITIENLGNGTVNFYLDGSNTVTVTTAAGPTGVSANNGEVFVGSSTNGANTTGNRVFLFDAKAMRLN